MENNKILIGAIFTDGSWSVQFELSVLHDMLLKDLFSGIVNGIHNIPGITEEDKNRCFAIYSKLFKLESFKKSQQNGFYFDGISLSSYLRDDNRENYKIPGQPFRFFFDDLNSSLTDIGFISSSVIIFDGSGDDDTRNSKYYNEIGSDFVIREFSDQNPDLSSVQENTVEFPEYNISTRRMIYFDDSPEKIISPGEAPQRPQISLLTGIFPVLSSVILIASRSLDGGSFSWSNSSAFTFITVGLGILGSIITAIKQRKDYRRSLRDWKQRYQDYVARKIESIRKRQKNYSDYLGKRYPKLSARGGASIPIITADVYSRHPEDDDFLSVTLGPSLDVRTPFEIQGEKADRVYSDSFFKWNDGTKSSVSIFIGNERDEEEGGKEVYYNLSELPGIVAKEYEYQKEPTQYVYPVGKKGAVGIVGASMARNKLIDSIILDLCYYHSPDNLQIIMLFNKLAEDDSKAMEDKIARYKYLPHFRELFNGLSQFVFDQTSANLVFGNVLKILSERKTESSEAEGADIKLTPHIMFIVADGEDYGLKEHALSELLPDPPKKGEQFVNITGCTFIYGAYKKEYLPSFCNDVLNVSLVANGQVDIASAATEIVIDEYQNTVSEIVPSNELSDSVKEVKVLDPSSGSDVSRIYRLLSAIHYARLAQNSRIPSSVSLFDLCDGIPSDDQHTSVDAEA